MRVLRDLDVDMTNLHAFGTIDMMRAAVDALTRPDGTRPLLIAVTQLTSTSQERMTRELLIDRPLDEVVMHYAKNAREAGLDGVVCSPLEAGSVHEACGADFITVTPGVRFAENAVGDQVRVTTPARAKRDRFGLHRRRPPNHGGAGSRRGVRPLHGGICRLNRILN